MDSYSVKFDNGAITTVSAYEIEKVELNPTTQIILNHIGHIEDALKVIKQQKDIIETSIKYIKTGIIK